MDLEAVGHAVFGGDSGDSDGLMAYVNGVGDNDGLRFGVDGPLAMVVLEGDTRAESIISTEIPGVTIARFLWMMTGQPRWTRGVTS